MIEELKQIIEARREAAQARADADMAEARVADLEAEMIERLAQMGVSEIVIDGVKVQVKRTVTAKAAAPRDSVIKAFYDAGLAEMLYETWPSSTVSAMFRSGDEPDALRSVFERHERVSLRVNVPA